MSSSIASCNEEGTFSKTMSKRPVAQSQMSWMQQEKPTIRQLNHLQWSPNEALMRVFGVSHRHPLRLLTLSNIQLWYRTYRMQQPWVGCRMEKDQNSKRPWLDLKVPGQFSQHAGPTVPYATTTGCMRHGKGSGQQTPMARPQVPGQFSQHVGPAVPGEFQQNPQCRCLFRVALDPLGQVH